MHKTNKKPFKRLKKRYKTIIRENNLVTLYVLMFALALIYVFPIIIYSTIYLVTAIVGSGIVLVGYVVVHRTIDYRNRSLPERLIQSLPDVAYKYRSTAKVLNGSNQQWQVIEPTKLIEADVVVDAIPSVKQLSLLDAIKQSTTDSWIIGQNDTGYCELSIRDLVHLGLIGKTGSGKTASTALLLMIHALKNGFNVIALDGKSGVDWSKYNTHIEAYSTDYTTFPNQVDQLCALHDNRMMEVKKAGVSNVDELPNKLSHVLVICEEYGHICQALQAADKPSFNATISKMSNLMRVSRSTGIHFLLIDQLPNHWDKTIKANLGGMIGYRIKGQLANGFGMYKLGELKPVGQFCYDEEIYNAWFTKGEIDGLLKGLPKLMDRLLSDVVIEDTTKIEDSNKIIAADGGATTLQSLQPTLQPTEPTTVTTTEPSNPLPKAVANRLDFVTKLIEIAKTEQLNDSKIRKLCKELTGKSLDGVASKTILDYINSQVQK